MRADTPPNSFGDATALPNLPVVMATANAAIWIGEDGDISRLSPFEASKKLANQTALFCHRKWTAQRLGIELLDGLDALELFAFCRPAQFCLPTAQGLANAAGFDSRGDDETQALLIPEACQFFLDELQKMTMGQKQNAIAIASMMTQGGWGWGALVLNALGGEMPPQSPINIAAANIWHAIADNADYGSNGTPGAMPIDNAATLERLAIMLGQGAEVRENQKTYTMSLTPAFNTPKKEDDPQIVLAEAGTGTGKTLGYLAAATIWAEKNKAPVWISTYTRNLQHQIADEMTRFYPDQSEREAKTVIRKGRENYLCLLNFQDMLPAVHTNPKLAIAMGLMARWAAADTSGDLTGNRFPAWLIDLLGRGMTTDLADRNGECIHSACQHYQKCFVEKSRQKASRADIVIANHALIMINAAMNAIVPNGNSIAAPTRYIFDEGHHIFQTADRTFAATFSGAETADLRRWIYGRDGGRNGQHKTRTRGLKKRLEDYIAFNDSAISDLNEVMEAASKLPASGWQGRLAADNPNGVVEEFLLIIRKAIYARAQKSDQPYNLEVSIYPLDDETRAKALDLSKLLKSIAAPLQRLAKTLMAIVAENAEGLDSNARNKIEGVTRGLVRRANGPLLTWQKLLHDIAHHQDNGEFIDWMEAIRRDGHDYDVALHRHYLDPSKAFAETVLKPAHGAIITSATLTDPNNPDPNNSDPNNSDHSDASMTAPTINDWEFAERLTGAALLPSPAVRLSVASPFNYAEQTRVIIVNDLNQNDTAQTAAAMGQLFSACGGGALGLFTAIQRLKAVYKPLLAMLDDQKIPLYAQHMDAINLQTLLQMFREDPLSCLLGTDAVRDGIDVPGKALQLITFDRVPWPRPDMLFKARAEHYGKAKWSDHVTRMKLRQAFGRLIRRENDRGVFIFLDKRLPSRMLTAFPHGTPAKRCGLTEAVDTVSSFLSG